MSAAPSRQARTEVMVLAPRVMSSVIRAGFWTSLVLFLAIVVTAGLELTLLSLKPEPVAIAASGVAVLLRPAAFPAGVTR